MLPGTDQFSRSVTRDACLDLLTIMRKAVDYTRQSECDGSCASPMVYCIIYIHITGQPVRVTHIVLPAMGACATI
jgi:hypothetical protein